MATAVAARGGIGAGLLNEEQLGAQIPPPPAPRLKANERCFRSRIRELVLTYKDQPTVQVGAETVPGYRQRVRFAPHPSGLFGEVVTDRADEIEILLDAAGLKCRVHKVSFSECDQRRCKPSMPPGEVWEAASQVADYLERRSAQLLAELAGNPELLKKVSGLGEAADVFVLEAVTPRKGKQSEAKTDQKPEAKGGSDTKTDGAAGGGGLNT